MAAQISSAGPVRIACVQMEPHIGDVAANRAATARFIETAARQGARLIVLPELCNSGYVFHSREEALALAEEIPAGDTCRLWCALAHRLRVYIVAGIAERDGTALYNAAVVIGPDGYVGKYRKLHLWNQENLHFSPGDLGVPVFDTPFGRVGVAVCYDGWFPEVYRMAALQGADLVCVPTNWVPMPDQPPGQHPMAVTLTMASAHSNALFIACADRVGIERGQPFIGGSVIVHCSGWPAAGPASRDDEAIVYADLDLSEARDQRRLTEFNQLLSDRRGDVYGDYQRLTK
ncbi:MAG TPA: nitrilase family protein [Duganella sp.]|uniref:nitrilase family protein n=1 Tax=Duganella sp. TaxID=1904440 RepID=UPI002ED4BAE7